MSAEEPQTARVIFSGLELTIREPVTLEFLNSEDAARRASQIFLTAAEEGRQAAMEIRGEIRVEFVDQFGHPIEHVPPPDWISRDSNENAFRHRNFAGMIDREKVIAIHGSYDDALLAHYQSGGKHPDDFNLPINYWDSTP